MQQPDTTCGTLRWTNSFSSYRVVISRASPHHWSWIQLFLLLKPLSCLVSHQIDVFVCKCNGKPSWCYASLLPKALLWWHIPQFEPNVRRQREADVGDEGSEWSKCLRCWQPVANSPRCHLTNALRLQKSFLFIAFLTNLMLINCTTLHISFTLNM